MPISGPELEGPAPLHDLLGHAASDMARRYGVSVGDQRLDLAAVEATNRNACRAYARFGPATGGSRRVARAQLR